MKKLRILLLLVFILGTFNMNMFSDDKELFLGVNAGSDIIKPNVMFLLDSSGSMQEIIYYPKLGPDGLAGTTDDGYDQGVNYPGGTMYNYRSVNNLTSRLYMAYLQIDSNHIINKTDGNADSDCENLFNSDWIKVEYDHRDRYVVGQWVFDINGQARGKIAEKWTDDNSWLRLTDIGPAGNTFQTGSDNIQMYLEEDIREVSGDSIRIDTFGATLYLPDWWLVDKGTGAKAQIDTIDTATGWITLKNRVGDFAVGGRVVGTEVAAGLELKVLGFYGTNTGQSNVWLGNNYMEWLFYNATDAQRAVVTNFTTYGTFDLSVLPADAPLNQVSSCGSVNGTKRVWTRTQVLREVACQVAENSYEKVKMGMFRFNSANGGRWVADIADLEHPSDPADLTLLQAYKNTAYTIPASGNTPLAEALGDIWRYYKPGSDAYELNGWVDKDYKIVTDGTFDVDTSPVEHWCQKNYVVLITDGNPTGDTFDDSRWSTNGSIFTDPSSSYQRTAAYTSWSTWSPADGWGDLDSTGHYYLDDVAYFLRNQDMFPDVLFPDWPGDQNIYTFTIGFALELPLLEETALNGDGAYYTATNFDDLINAFDNIINTIILRNFAFSSITAPKKTAATTTENLNISYVGYFLPSTSKSVWEGHLLAKELEEKWGYDKDLIPNGITFDELYDTKAACDADALVAGKICTRVLNLSETQKWDAYVKMLNRSTARNLFYYDGDGLLATDIKAFTALSDETDATRLSLFKEATSAADATIIETKLYLKEFGDIYHSDVSFLGKPISGKKYIRNINPTECVTDPSKCYQAFYDAKQTRDPVLYVGTNNGILHMVDAHPLNGGEEIWGFIPDEVLPAVKRIANSTEHEYTVDGRINIEDIFYQNGSTKEWRSVLCFGLRRGGNAYYMMDVSDVGTKPKLLWKFKDDVTATITDVKKTYSGQSFSKPLIVKMRMKQIADPDKIEDKWVAIFTGGFAFNDEDITDSRGKAIFIVDASTGELIWKIGYNNADGAEDVATYQYLETAIESDRKTHLTKSELFNYSIPSSLSVVDKDNNGFVDSIYFGNKAGHLFKIDTMNLDRDNWRVYNLYTHSVVDETTFGTVSAIITAVDNTIPKTPVITVDAPLSVMYIDYNLIAIRDSDKAYSAGKIDEITGNKVKVLLTSDSTFVTGQVVSIKTWDPIYLEPTLAFDSCYNLWIAFGTGDRDRPRTNPTRGKMVAFMEKWVYNLTLSNLVDLASGLTLPPLIEDGSTWSVTETDVAVSATKLGFYYKFPNIREKLFDPKPIILPDKNFQPHIIFNTYQPPVIASGVIADPCDAPDEGNMQYYDIGIGSCPDFMVTLKKTGGRIAGGGIYNPKEPGPPEYVIYKGGGSVGGTEGTSAPPPKTLPYTGRYIFWKEKKR